MKCIQICKEIISFIHWYLVVGNSKHEAIHSNYLNWLLLNLKQTVGLYKHYKEIRLKQNNPHFMW
jgi:hypothetical protein